MDFCISRIEHYKMHEAVGVFREATRNLSRYPNSNVVSELTRENVCFCSLIDGQKNIEEQIRDLKKEYGIGGRFNTGGGKSKNLTNVMSQVFFKLAPGFLEGKSFQEIVGAYADCMDWFQKKYPSVIIVSADVHFDEPDCGPHMHICFLPIYRDGEKLKFSSTNVFAGRDHYAKYQDEVHAWAVEHFNHDFARRKPGNEKAKHLDLPEFKAAMREKELIEKEMRTYEPAIMAISEISDIGKPALFGGYKVTGEQLDILRGQAIDNIKMGLDLQRTARERDEYKRRYEKERENANRLARENLSMRSQLERIREWFVSSKIFSVFERLISVPFEKRIRNKDRERSEKAR